MTYSIQGRMSAAPASTVVLSGLLVETESEPTLLRDFAKLRTPFQRLLPRGMAIATDNACISGFELARLWEEMQVLCVVAAPGKLPRESADRI